MEFPYKFSCLGRLSYPFKSWKKLADPNSYQRKKELFLRVGSGVPALMAVLALVGFGTWPMVAVVLLAAALLGMYEYHRMLTALGAGGLDYLTMALATVLILCGSMLGGQQGMGGMLALGIGMVIVRCLMGSEGSQEKIMRRVAFGVFGVIWIPWNLGHLVLVVQGPWGPPVLFVLLLAVTGSDTLAFVTGKLIGRHKLAPSISPGKTIEGALGGLLGGVAGGWVATIWLVPLFPDGDLIKIALLSVLLSVMGQLGDLMESLVKRAAGVKDSGRFLPGHGGYLDRLDAFLLVPPFFYYALIWLQL